MLWNLRSEIRIEDQKILIIKEGNLILYHTGTKEGHNGIGFLIRKRFINYKNEIRGTIDRITLLIR